MENNNEINPVLTVGDIASRLNISKQMLYKLASTNKILHYRFGKTIRFSEHDYSAFLGNNIGELVVYDRTFDKMLKHRAFIENKKCTSITSSIEEQKLVKE